MVPWRENANENRDALGWRQEWSRAGQAQEAEVDVRAEQDKCPLPRIGTLEAGARPMHQITQLFMNITHTQTHRWTHVRPHTHTHTYP